MIIYKFSSLLHSNLYRYIRRPPILYFCMYTKVQLITIYSQIFCLYQWLRVVDNLSLVYLCIYT